MGIRIAGINISGIVNKEIGGKVLTDKPSHDAILISIVAGTRTGNLTGGTQPTETSHTCTGFIDSQNRESVGGTLIEDGDIVIGLIGDSIADAAVPKGEDKITIEGSTYRIKGIDRDPAAAMYTCLSRAD